LELSSVAKSGGVDTYFDSPSTSGKSLDDLLARPDISAVIVVLPIVAQPDVIKKVLAAGKHVLSEKPVAKDVASAKELIGWYEQQVAMSGLVWGVAENYRFTKSLVFAVEKVKEVGGTVTSFSLKMNSFVKPDNKYFNTACQ
jgi:predicted dehydrogenase